VVEAVRLGQLYDLDQVLPEAGLPSRQLHGVAADGPLLPQDPEHLVDLLYRGLVDVAEALGVVEAVPARQVAAVGHRDVGQGRVAEVEPAEAAVLGAEGVLLGHLGVLHPPPVQGVVLRPAVPLGGAEVELLELPVLRADLLHPDLPLGLVEGGGEDLEALRANGGGLSDFHLCRYTGQAFNPTELRGEIT
jgi:hypothetical protein